MHPSRGIRAWLSPTLALYDDRGKRTPMIGLADLRESLREADKLDEFDAIRRRSGLVVSSVLQPIVGIAALWTLVAVVIGSPTAPISLGVMLPVGAVWIWHDWPSRLVRRVRRAMLSRNRCPSCGFEIDPNTREPDLRVLCRECGSAWLPVE